MNNPIPSNLKSEAKKAAKILREFTEISSRSGPDKIIPAHVIAKAQGLAVLSVIKAGFLVTARGGSGIVLARLPDGRWSAPSAIGIAGLGGGFEIGIEVSDLVIIMNHKRAVEAFAKGGNLTLGGNFTVAIGPLGRNLEGDVAIRSSAAVYTYCKSRGLFAGISLEGSGLIERKETNRKFYCQEDIRAYEILFGEIPRPALAEELYDILDSFTEKYEIEEQSISRRKTVREQRKKEMVVKSNRLQSHRTGNGTEASRPTQRSYPDLSSFNMNERGSRGDYVTATAIYPFDALQPGDLSFQAGDKIMVTTKTDSQYDWWEGKLKGELGIFPANYVMI
ncbi:SH3 domain-containing YSC84-like protein 1 isoform X4 [Hyla sarda]|uniref:SH3 domain-containing YSC84-like protein 1 isoform X2 n=1 Tax=Hyla sarda TaxID=327740 RepID=UPI0024C46E88|nr:SH3 domain-containing YSC84-like protein 1 isoform X2 [Hyla sarda]XP_056420041.1 SH3 domain-containing YSC84-like protein 1 isoform X3 [Hyla sarda]XP_056420043.1 SH3 domain-containing YSC84-like protein 1 isoform X4 [Hyla sarda]